MDGEASSPARCRASNLRFEPSAVSPKAKPENPKGFQPPCHPHQFLLKSKRFPGAKTARKRFLLWKMRFSGAKIVPCPPYTPLGAIESSRGLRPSRALRGFFDSLSDSLKGIAFGGRLRPPGGSPRRMALPSLRVGRQQANFGEGLGERSAGPTATCCRVSYRQAMRYPRPSPSRGGNVAP